MKTKLFTLIILLFSIYNAKLYPQISPDYIFGDNNGSSWSWTTGTQGTANLGNTFKWTFNANTTGNHYFKFGETASNSNGSGFWMNNNSPDLFYNGGGAIWNAYYYSDMGANGAIYFQITSGNYYVIKAKKDNNNSNCNFAIFDNGGTEPVTISSVQGSLSGSNFLVDVQLSAAKGSNEKVWVRYTTNNWTNSYTVEANVDLGSNKYQASIPNNNYLIEYYVYTTIGQVNAPAEDLADFYTINYANNNGNNYKANLVSKLNYNVESSTEAFTSLTGASSFTWTGTADEGYSSATNIGFNFNYCGTTFTQFQVSTNGFIRLGIGLTDATSSDNLAGATRNIIAPLWDNLSVIDLNTDITYKTEGAEPNRICIVEWKNVKWNKTAASANCSFQVKLYEQLNKIEFIYEMTSAPTSGSASIGMNSTTTISTITTPATGEHISINVGGTSTANRVYHISGSYLFNAISSQPATNTKLTFMPFSVDPIPSGTYTIGGTSPTFKSFSEAAQKLNKCGIAGPITINVREGVYDDIFYLNDVAGTSASNTITIQKESGDVTLTPNNGSGTSTAGSTFSSDAIVRLDGTQFTTIKDLKLINNNSSLTTPTFEVGIFVGNSVNTNSEMKTGARFNKLSNLYIDMKSKHSGSICIRYFTTSSAETDTSKGTSYNTIDGCTLTGFWRAAIKTFGISGTNQDLGNVIKNCNIGNVNLTTGSSSDIRAFELDCQANILIENNTVENISATIMTTNNIYGIWFNPSSSTEKYNAGTITIRNNIIRNLENSGTGTTIGFAVGIASNNVANNTTFYIYNNQIYDIYSNGNSTSRAVGIGLYLGTGTPTYAHVYNNMIYDLRAPRSTSTPAVRGIDCQNTGGNGSFSVYNNTVYLDNATPPTASAHQSTCIYWANFSSASLDLKNNILVNLMSTTSGKAVCLYPSANSNYLRLAQTTNNNLYYFGSGSNQGLSWDVATLRTTLAAHQAAIATGGLGGPRDLDAINSDITSGFESSVSPYNLKIKNTSWIVNGQGVPNAIVTTDFEGDTRSTINSTGPVDIGADEYSPTGSATTSVTGTISDGSTTTYTGVDGKTVAIITWHENTGQLPTSVTVNYTPGAQATGTTNPSIYRNYTINSVGGTAGWSADLALYYNPSELNGFTESAMRINKKNEGVWQVLATTINTTNHFGTATVTSFSDFSFDDGTNPLPVELTSFQASYKNNLVTLTWATATEINSYCFEVERSNDNLNWVKIGSVDAGGNSNKVLNYEYFDNITSEGKYYYRLKQIDLDGSFKYSSIVEVNAIMPIKYSLSQNYPNPFNPTTKINYSIPENAKVTLNIYSLTGELVKTLVDEDLTAGNYTIDFDASGLASGTYFYRLIANDFVQTKKMLLIK